MTRHRMIAARRSGLGVLLDVADGIANGPDLFLLALGDLQSKSLFDRHDDLDGIKTVGTQIIHEVAALGDGILGPSDFFAFYALTVPAADIPAWRAALAASPVDKGTEAYAAPKAAAPWWVSKAEYQKLELFSPKSLTGRSPGWVGLAPDGRIFIYAFTM